jgi:hypothetical protein
MTTYYGVQCKTGRAAEILGGKACKTVFTFDIATDLSANQIEFPCPPLGGLRCPICQQLHSYSSDDVVVVALPDLAL